MATKTYRDLVVWQKSVDIITESYKLTKKLPKSELFGLTSQMNRSALSVAGNIAEGYGRSSPGDFLRFLRISRGSLCELETYFIVGVRLDFFVKKDLLEVWKLCDAVGKMLTRLIQKLEKDQQTKTNTKK